MLRALRRPFAMGGISLAVLFGFAIPASATGRIVHPGQSIQAAIDAASPGDTIIVGAGTYHEQLLITKDGLTIVAAGATLEPTAAPTPSTPCDVLFANDPANPPPALNGICIAGEADQMTNEITNPVSNTRIIGLHINGFQGSGIFQYAGENSRFVANTATDNGAYGIFALTSTGTQVVANHTSGSGEAGIYIGDSPSANANVLANDTSDNGFGIFVRDAERVTLVGNRSHNNCIGILFLGDAPGPVGAADVRGNSVRDNTKVCPPTEENPDTISGLGIVLLGAHDVNLHNNIIKGNKPGPGGEATLFSGGVAVVASDAGTAATGNTVRANIFANNRPDILWDGAGSNTFTTNLCHTSTPDGLC